MPNGQNGAFRVLHHFFGDAAEQNVAESGPAMSSDHDQVDGIVLGVLRDRVKRSSRSNNSNDPLD